jgi:hypothetical protein
MKTGFVREILSEKKRQAARIQGFYGKQGIGLTLISAAVEMPRVPDFK